MKIAAYIKNLGKYHDELADLKSYFDGHKGEDDTYDEQHLCFKSCVSYILVMKFVLLSWSPTPVLPFKLPVPRKVSSLRQTVRKIEMEHPPQPQCGLRKESHTMFSFIIWVL